MPIPPVPATDRRHVGVGIRSARDGYEAGADRRCARRARPITSSRSTPGRASAFDSSRTRAPRGHTRSARVASRVRRRPAGLPRRSRARTGATACAARPGASVPVAGRRLGIDPPARLRVRAVRRDVVEQLGARLRVTVRLRELHDGAVRFARHQERFLPLRIGHVDVHGMEARAAHALERGREVGHLEREVMRARRRGARRTVRGSRSGRRPTVRAARPACRRRRRSRATPASGESRSPGRRRGRCRRARR